MLFKSIEEQFNEIASKSGVRYELDQSISGHYRLIAYDDVLSEYEIIHEDPACEDLYDKESAMAIFIEDIRERHNL